MAALVGATAVGGGFFIARAYYRPVDQACPAPVANAHEVCSVLYGGRHEADGLPSTPITAAFISARAGALPRYPASHVVELRDVSAEQEVHFNGRRGYQSAQAAIAMDVEARPADMLRWYHDSMQAQGWKEQPVTYGAPQLTVRSFLRGHRESATLDIDAADYLPLRHLTYDLYYSIDPYLCDGRGGCGDLGAISFSGM